MGPEPVSPSVATSSGFEYAAMNSRHISAEGGAATPASTASWAFGLLGERLSDRPVSAGQVVDRADQNGQEILVCVQIDGQGARGRNAPKVVRVLCTGLRHCPHLFVPGRRKRYLRAPLHSFRDSPDAVKKLLVI
jgi:hypothetical protein